MVFVYACRSRMAGRSRIGSRPSEKGGLGYAYLDAPLFWPRIKESPTRERRALRKLPICRPGTSFLAPLPLLVNGLPHVG